MLALLICSLALSACRAEPLPDRALPHPRPTHYVTDAGDLLSDEEERALNARLSEIDSASSVQIAVLTIPTLGGDTPEAYALRTAQAWGVGQAEVNNGALILLSAAERELHVQVGTGLEWQVPDSTAARIVRQMVPAFRKGAFGEGVRTGVDALADLATAVPWAVSYTSVERALAEPSPVGRIVRLCGVFRDGNLEVDKERVGVAFPPYWSGANGSPMPGDTVRYIGRIKRLAPMDVQVLGVGRAPCS